MSTDEPSGRSLPADREDRFIEGARRDAKRIVRSERSPGTPRSINTPGEARQYAEAVSPFAPAAPAGGGEAGRPGPLDSPRSPSSRSRTETRTRPPLIPDYELAHLIGRGGFGEVWLARERLTGVFYAVKVIPRDRIGAAELEGVRTYKQRAAGHPHLINLEHVGETDQCYYYAMELADDARGAGVRDPGEYKAMTLSEHLRRHGPVPVAEAVAITCDLLDALEHLHAAGLLHRDVKPANVLRRDGRWKLGDVGLVTTHAETESRPRTPAYSPPGGVCDRTGDLFCLGRLLHKLVTGTSQRADEQAQASAEGLRPVPAQLSGVIDRACDADPANRFQTAAEMRAALRPDSELSSVKATPARGKTAPLIALLLIGAVAAAVWWSRGMAGPAAGPQDRPARMEVHFKRAATEPGFDVLSEASVPLPTGSLIQVHADLGRPGYPYLFGVSANEAPVLLDPSTGQSLSAVSELWSPVLAPEGQKQQWHRLDPPAGPVMLLLVVADAPIGQLDELTAQLKDLRCPEINRFMLLEGDPEAPLLHWNRSRGLEPRAAEAPKGLLEAVPDDWRSRFRSVRILVFSHEASAALPDGVQP